MVHLLELAARILVDLALAREDVQFFQQLQGLAGAQVELIAWGLDLGGGVFGFGHGGIVPLWVLMAFAISFGNVMLS